MSKATVKTTYHEKNIRTGGRIKLWVHHEINLVTVVKDKK